MTTNTEKSVKEALKKKNWTLEDWKTSKSDTDRLIWFIAIQSPHNLWRASEALDSLLSQAKREIAKDLDEIHASFPEDSPSQEWWEATDKLLDYIQKLKSHLINKKDTNNTGGEGKK